MNKQEANAEIAAKVRAAYALIDEAEKLADEHGLDFSFELAYGMGGTYYGEGHQYTWADKGWNASSQSC